MNVQRDARHRNHAHRPGTDWYRAVFYLVGGISLALFWYLAIVTFLLVLG